MATTTNYSLPLIESSEYSSKLFSDFVAMLCGNSNSSALVMIDALLKGKASLIDGKVPSNELPSYVDDVIEGYLSSGTFYSTKSGSTYSDALTGETGKIYVDKDSNSTYRWSGSQYVQVGGTDKLLFTNVTASNWVSDNTYSDYGYKCDITCNGITSSSIVHIMFDITEATSGDYAPVCVTSSNTVTIYGKVNTSITIPTIKEI